MTAPGPVEQERTALNQLITTLAYAQSAEVVWSALTVFPGVIPEGIRLLFTIPQVRGLLRIHPHAGAHQAVQAMYQLNLTRRASYLAQAARRVSTAAQRGPSEVLSALDKERRYLTQHLAADAGRTMAARAVAAQARSQARQAKNDSSTWNGLLGWYTTLDTRTSPECRRANGRNFDPTHVPAIGFPGTVHPECRCRMGPPHPAGKRVEKLRPDLTDAVRGRARARDTGWRAILVS